MKNHCVRTASAPKFDLLGPIGEGSRLPLGGLGTPVGASLGPSGQLGRHIEFGRFRRIGRSGGFVRKLARRFQFRALPGIILGAPGSPGDRLGRSRDLENVVFA